MAYAEAIAHGVPVVGTTAGAIPETVPAGAGVLVPPDDVEALAAALRRLIEQPERAAARRRRARAARFRPGASRRALFAPCAGALRMSGFSAEWLALREPYDLAARNATVLDAVVDRLRRATPRSRSSISPAAPARRCARSGRICRRGRTGAWSTTISACWRKASALGRPPHVTVIATPVDLVRDLELALDGPLDLVTTSALLDLVSAEWLDRLVVEAAARRLPVYAALTYDGRDRHRAGRPARPRDPGRLQRPSAHRQGLRSRRSGRPRRRAPSSASSISAMRWCRAAPTGCSGRTTGPSRRRCSRAGPTSRPLTHGDCRPTRSRHGWRGAAPIWPQGRSHLRVGHVDIFARPIGTR